MIEEAERAREEQKEKVILFCYSGHGLMDLAGYDLFLRGELKDHAMPQAEMQTYQKEIAHHPKPKQGSVPAPVETRGGSSVNFYAAISCSATTGTASSARSAATSKSIPA